MYPFEITAPYFPLRGNHSTDFCGNQFLAILIFFFFFVFLGLNPQHMEVSRLGIKLELQLQAYTTATATPDWNHVNGLHHTHSNSGSLTH